MPGITGRFLARSLYAQKHGFGVRALGALSYYELARRGSAVAVLAHAQRRRAAAARRAHRRLHRSLHRGRAARRGDDGRARGGRGAGAKGLEGVAERGGGRRVHGQRGQPRAADGRARQVGEDLGAVDACRRSRREGACVEAGRGGARGEWGGEGSCPVVA